jgi:N-acyl homoserine lactone hydrolase
MLDTGHEIRRLDYGYIVRPGSEYGGDQPRAESILGYLVRRDGRHLLFDTGIGVAGPETEAHYQPVRRPLQQALAGAGITLGDIDLVVNCHLHFDHCGGNALLAGKPVFAQRTELDLARGPDYTIPALVDFPGVSYQELDGEAEIMPGVWVIPTPGHTAGHQSLAVEQPDGTIILAGQAFDFASDFSTAHLGHQTGLAAGPAWLDRILSFDPRRIVFAHDASIWQPT